MLLKIPINLLHLNTASKLSYWLKHLPYHKYYISHLQNTPHTTTIIQINKSELRVSQQIADIFYENALSGYTLNTFTKNDYQQILNFYKDIIDTVDITHEYIKYIYQLIHQSQQYYRNNTTPTGQLQNKNWMKDTYIRYVLNINEILDMLPPSQLDQINNLNTYRKPPNKNIVYIKSPTDKWRECVVVNVLENGKRWKIHYKGFSSKHDEIVESESTRLATIKPNNVVPSRKHKHKSKKLQKDNDRIWVQSVSNENIHRECKICEETENKYRIHFISYHEKHDMWINKSSQRIKTTRPLGDVLIKGDNLSCYNKQYKAWLEVEVIKVDAQKHRVKIGWVGSNKLKAIWLPANSKKLSIIHQNHDAPAPK